MTNLSKCCFTCFILLQLLLPSCTQVNTLKYNQAMYKAKREEHFVHLMEIAQLDDTTTMIELVTRLIVQLLELLNLHRSALLKATLARPDMAPNDVGAAEAYAMVVENCPFLADLILRFPDSAREVLAPHRSQYNELIAWAFEFTRQSKFPSETDLKLLTLAEQELNLIPRPNTYVNPFADATKHRQLAELREFERRHGKQELRSKLRRPRLTPRTEL
uniref:Coiled-coil domain-containing protein 134 n=1 Tax=Schistocephalus solidus TaxID=70667 RepID=A0A0V0J222_SCHSO